MNDKDKEALKERLSSMGFPDENSYLFYHKAWKAACEYKHKEIEELKSRLIRLFEPTRKFWDEDYRSRTEKLQAENANLREQDQIISQEIKTYIQIADRLQTENKKLREALVYIAKVYDRPTDMKVKARHILAELDKDNNDK